MRATALTAALACAACGAARPPSDPGPCAAPPGAEPPPAAFVSFRARYASAACASWVRCAPPSSFQEPVESCESGWGAERANRAFGPCAEQALRAGRVAFDPAMADACLAALTDAADCSPSSLSCGRVLRGMVAPMGYCGDEEGRSECATGTCNGEGCDSTCGALHGIEPGGFGDPCTSAGCEAALVCTDGVCMLPGDGEPCSGACRRGLACLLPADPMLGDEGTCGTPRASGDACRSDRECGVGLACHYAGAYDPAGPHGMCGPYGGEGAPCTGGSSDDCGVGLHCTAICTFFTQSYTGCGPGVCARRPTRVGDACVVTTGIIATHKVGVIDAFTCFGRDLACSGVSAPVDGLKWGTCYPSATALDTLDCRFNPCPVGYACQPQPPVAGPVLPDTCVPYLYQPRHACAPGVRT